MFTRGAKHYKRFVAAVSTLPVCSNEVQNRMKYRHLKLIAALWVYTNYIRPSWLPSQWVTATLRLQHFMIHGKRAT